MPPRVLASGPKPCGRQLLLDEVFVISRIIKVEVGVTCVVEITAEGRLASNCLDAWANAGFTASSHME